MRTKVATAWVCGAAGPVELTLWLEGEFYRWREADGSSTGVTATTRQAAWEGAEYVWKVCHIRGTQECPYCGY